MLIWIAPVILALLLLTILSWARLKIPRDLSREGIDDHESILAYDRVSRWLLFSVIRYFIIKRLKECRPEGLMIDIGCGPGYLALAIAGKYPQIKITGIDISPEMLSLASRNQSIVNLNHRVNFQEADVHSLPFENNHIDFAISSLSLHHWANPESALLEIYRVLKPGGQLLIFDLRRDTPRILFYTIQLVQCSLAPPPIRRVNGGVGSVWSSFTPAELEKILSKSLFNTWKVQKGWGWIYLWGKK